MRYVAITIALFAAGCGSSYVALVDDTANPSLIAVGPRLNVQLDSSRYILYGEVRNTGDNPVHIAGCHGADTLRFAQWRSKRSDQDSTVALLTKATSLIFWVPVSTRMSKDVGDNNKQQMKDEALSRSAQFVKQDLAIGVVNPAGWEGCLEPNPEWVRFTWDETPTQRTWQFVGAILTVVLVAVLLSG